MVLHSRFMQNWKRLENVNREYARCEKTKCRSFRRRRCNDSFCTGALNALSRNFDVRKVVASV